MKIKLKHEELARVLPEKKLSQNAWARRFGMSRGHLSNLVNGNRPYPSPETRQRLLDVLGVAFGDLFEIENAEPRRLQRPRKALRLALGRFIFGLEIRDTPPSQAMFPFWSGSGSDLKLSLRRLGRQPLLATVAILSFALGIGAAAATASLIEAALFGDLPFEEPDRLVNIKEAGSKITRSVVSLRQFKVWKQKSDSFDALALLWPRWNPVLQGQGRPRRVGALKVSGDVFPLLRVEAYRGRLLGPGDDHSASDALVVSYSFWQKALGQAPIDLHPTLLLDNRVYTVVGVLPPRFRYFSLKPDVIAAISMDQANQGELFFPLGRLKMGVSTAQAAAQLTTIQRPISTFQEPSVMQVTNLSDSLEISRYALRDKIYILTGAVCLALLVAGASS